MIVQVRVDRHTLKFVNVPLDDEDQCRRIAFRFVNQDAEKDYNELMHNTKVIEVEALSTQLIGFLERM